MNGPIVLRGSSWDHPRGQAPMLATASEYERNSGGTVQIEWTPRSLKAFGSASIDDLARDYDLILVDHPHIGSTGRSRAVLPLDEFLEAERARSIGAEIAWSITSELRVRRPPMGAGGRRGMPGRRLASGPDNGLTADLARGVRTCELWSRALAPLRGRRGGKFLFVGGPQRRTLWHCQRRGRRSSRWGSGRSRRCDGSPSRATEDASG